MNTPPAPLIPKEVDLECPLWLEDAESIKESILLKPNHGLSHQELLDLMGFVPRGDAE